MQNSGIQHFRPSVRNEPWHNVTLDAMFSDKRGGKEARLNFEANLIAYLRHANVRLIPDQQTTWISDLLRGIQKEEQLWTPPAFVLSDAAAFEQHALETCIVEADD